MPGIGQLAMTVGTQQPTFTRLFPGSFPHSRPVYRQQMTHSPQLCRGVDVVKIQSRSRAVVAAPLASAPHFEDQLPFTLHSPELEKPVIPLARANQLLLIGLCAGKPLSVVLLEIGAIAGMAVTLQSPALPSALSHFELIQRLLLQATRTYFFVCHELNFTTN